MNWGERVKKISLKFFGFIIFFTFVGCNKEKTTSTPIVQGPLKCVPEKQLLAANIVGGQTVEANSTDSHKVVILYSSINDKDGELCTATPVALNVLLTAAHCVDKADAAQSFAAFYTSLSCESGFDVRKNAIKVTSFKIHPDYQRIDESSDKASAEGTQSDLALVFLETIVPAQYPIYKIAQAADVAVDSTIYFYGYGVNSSNGGGSGYLRKTEFQRSQYQIDESQNKISVDQTGGTGICSGDSGGPGLIEVNGELEILGVNSYVQGPKNNICAGRGVLTLADSYRSWISDEIRKQQQLSLSQVTSH